MANIAAEQDRRSDDRVGDSDAGESPFDLGLAAKIRIGRVERRVRDRDVHDVLDACLSSRLEESAAVGDRRLMVDPTVREANPVRVVESPNAAQGIGELGAIGEIQRPDRYVRARRRSVRMGRQRAHLPPGGLQLSSNRSA
jgi:hypothetical protein